MVVFNPYAVAVGGPAPTGAQPNVASTAKQGEAFSARLWDQGKKSPNHLVGSHF